MTDLEAWERVERIERVLDSAFSKQLHAQLALVVKDEEVSRLSVERFVRQELWNRGVR